MNFSQQFIQFTSFSALLCYHAYSVGGYTLSCYTKTLLGSCLYVDIIRVKSQSRRYAPLHIGNELVIMLVLYRKDPERVIFMILALDIGNTNITIGVYEGKQLRFVQSSSFLTCSSSFILLIPLYLSSLSGKCRPISPSAAAPSIASISACTATSASL